MGAAENRAKSAAQAAYMKEKGITRSTGSCPWGCGAQIKNGGQALMNHLNSCKGGGFRRLQRVMGRIRR